VGGDFDPDERAIRAAEPKQVVGHRAVPAQTVEKLLARERIDEAFDLEGSHFSGVGLPREAEHQFQIRIRRERGRGSGFDEADVDAFMYRLEQPREGFSSRRRGCRHAAYGSTEPWTIGRRGR
jgi:hypothetical protein